MRTELHNLTDDGHVPNNLSLPLVIYHEAITNNASADDIIEQFARNQWSGAWINGIFDFHHYHARSHEVLANLGRAATVQFGGASGPVIEFPNGAAVVIPAGGGHCRLSSGAGLVIVGAYPAGQENWNLKRADNAADYALAKTEIPLVALPAHDPLTGDVGPLLELWQS